jgi:hypothetical protein
MAPGAKASLNKRNRLGCNLNLKFAFAAQVDLLYQDIERLIHRDGSLTPARVAEMVGLSSEWIVRNIRKPNWYVKNVAHLFKIERILSEHPNWHPKTIHEEKEYAGDESFVFRRLVDPYEAPEFRELALRWSARGSDKDFIKRAMTDPWVNIVDISADDPQEYQILHYGEAMSRASGINKTGARLGQHASKAYADMTCEYFHETVLANTPRCRDVVYFAKSRVDHVIYRGVALPCLDEKVVVSKMTLEYCAPTHAKVWRRATVRGEISIVRSSSSP